MSRRGYLVHGSRRRTLAAALTAVLALSLAGPVPAHAGIKEAVADGVKAGLSWAMEAMFGVKIPSNQTDSKVTLKFVESLIFTKYASGSGGARAAPSAAGSARPAIQPTPQPSPQPSPQPRPDPSPQPSPEPNPQPRPQPPPEPHRLEELNKGTTAIALGGLTAIVTMAVLRFWIGGLSMNGRGGVEALEGLGRALLAVALILLWPTFFEQTVALANQATSAVWNLPGVKEDIAGALSLFGGGTGTAINVGGFLILGWLVVIVVLLIAGLLLLGIVVMKLFIAAALAFLFVAMPILLMLWPLPETGWLARSAGRAYVVCLAVPVIWALLFATFGAVDQHGLMPVIDDSFLPAWLFRILTAIVLLWLMMTIPRSAAKLAMTGAVSPNAASPSMGFVGHMGSYMAARMADRSISHFVSGRLGGVRPQGKAGMEQVAKGVTPAEGVYTRDGRREHFDPKGMKDPKTGQWVNTIPMDKEFAANANRGEAGRMTAPVYDPETKRSRRPASSKLNAPYYDSEAKGWTQPEPEPGTKPTYEPPAPPRRRMVQQPDGTRKAIPHELGPGGPGRRGARHLREEFETNGFATRIYSPTPEAGELGITDVAQVTSPTGSERYYHRFGDQGWRHAVDVSDPSAGRPAPSPPPKQGGDANVGRPADPVPQPPPSDTPPAR